jgi:hypothetical protein
MVRTREPSRHAVRRWLRPPAGLVLALQLTAAIATPVAHALLGAGNPVAHVEAQGNESCPAAHHHVACQICRTITAPAASAAAPRIPLRDSPVHAQAPVAPAQFAPVRPTGLGPRGPPLA